MATKIWHRFPVLAGLVVVGTMSGCGGTGFTLNDQVEGTVTMDGRPVPGVFVDFFPVGTPDPKTPVPSSSAVTDENGHYKLQADKRPGAALGKHKVVIRAGRGSDRSGDPQASDVAAPAAGRRTPAIPSQYSLAATTPLEIEVTADKHDYPLTITR